MESCSFIALSNFFCNHKEVQSIVCFMYMLYVYISLNLYVYTFFCVVAKQYCAHEHMLYNKHENRYATISLKNVLHEERFESWTLWKNLDVATPSWAMRDRPTWDQHRVPLRAKHNWFKACSELTFRCNPPRAEEEVLCLQRCSTRHRPAVQWRARVSFFFSPKKSAWQTHLIVCQWQI